MPAANMPVSNSVTFSEDGPTSPHHEFDPRNPHIHRGVTNVESTTATSSSEYVPPTRKRPPPPPRLRCNSTENHEYATFERNGEATFSVPVCPRLQVHAKWGLQMKTLKLALKPIATSLVITVLAVTAVNTFIFIHFWQELSRLNTEVIVLRSLINNQNGINVGLGGNPSLEPMFQTGGKRNPDEEESLPPEELDSKEVLPTVSQVEGNEEASAKRGKRENGRGNKRKCKKKKHCMSMKKNVIKEVKFHGGMSQILVQNNSQIIGPWVQVKGGSGNYALRSYTKDGNSITVNQKGVYWIYVQLYYEMWQEFSGFNVYVKKANYKGQARIIAECSVSGVSESKLSQQTCFTGVAWYINVGDKIFVEQLHKNVVVKLDEGQSFLGLIKLQDDNDSK